MEPVLIQRQTDKLRDGRSFRKPYLDKKCEIKRYSGPEKVVKYKSLKHDQNSQFGGSGDELVKHMSNLPGFLQRVEKDKNSSSIQEKALNFGVLDWKHLEKWKYNERMPAKRSSSLSSTNSFLPANGPPKMDPTLRNQPRPLSSRFTSPQKRQMQFHSKHPSSSKEESTVERLTSKAKPTSDQESPSVDNQKDSFHKKLQFFERSCSKTNVYDAKKSSKNSIIPEQEDSHDNIFQGKKIGAKLNEEVNSLSECLTEKFQTTSCSESFRFSLDEELEDSIGNRLSDCTLYPDIFSGELSATTDIPRSCPLPSGASYHMDPTAEDLNNCTFACPFPPERIKGRSQSPIRRFSFSLGKMGRSLSFKESSGSQQSSSSQYTAVKSGPVMMNKVQDNSERDKESPARKSSPLRRLIDPLLKHKGSQSPIRPPKATMKNSNGTTSQALLQLSLKNGLPFFKLVVDNNSDMLAAVAKKIPASVKNGESCLMYSFYSVREVKKKGINWLSQGSKGKSCSLGYNMIGRMDISISTNARECVLYGIDPPDKQMHECIFNKEMAAIVVETEGVKVILPGGVHGVPIEGSPSSLVSRWRSGGVCDCGGWDVGCKLQILGGPIPNSCAGRFNLCVQGGDKKRKPVLNLETFNKELYSIESDASVSLLEAFATCVAYITCLNFSEILNSNDESDAKYLLEESITDKVKTSNSKAFPPSSPAGRI